MQVTRYQHCGNRMSDSIKRRQDRDVPPERVRGAVFLGVGMDTIAFQGDELRFGPSQYGPPLSPPDESTLTLTV